MLVLISYLCCVGVGVGVGGWIGDAVVGALVGYAYANDEHMNMIVTRVLDVYILQTIYMLNISFILT